MIQIQNRCSIDPTGVKELSRIRELSRSIHQVLGGVEIAFKKMIEKLDR